MKHKHIVIKVVGILLLLIIGLKVLAVNMSFGADGLEVLNNIPQHVFDSASECAVKQKNLYLCIDAFYQESGSLPKGQDDLVHTLINCEGNKAMAFLKCPLSNETKGIPYTIYPENFGNAEAVFIEDSSHKHPNTFWLSFRGTKPCVQTMGDGTIHLFKGGKLIVTMNAQK